MSWLPRLEPSTPPDRVIPVDDRLVHELHHMNSDWDDCRDEDDKEKVWYEELCVEEDLVELENEIGKEVDKTFAEVHEEFEVDKAILERANTVLFENRDISIRIKRPAIEELCVPMEDQNQGFGVLQAFALALCNNNDMGAKGFGLLAALLRDEAIVGRTSAHELNVLLDQAISNDSCPNELLVTLAEMRCKVVRGLKVVEALFLRNQEESGLVLLGKMVEQGTWNFIKSERGLYMYSEKEEENGWLDINENHWESIPLDGTQGRCVYKHRISGKVSSYRPCKKESYRYVETKQTTPNHRFKHAVSAFCEADISSSVVRRLVPGDVISIIGKTADSWLRVIVYPSKEGQENENAEEDGHALNKAEMEPFLAPIRTLLERFNQHLRLPSSSNSDKRIEMKRVCWIPNRPELFSQTSRAYFKFEQLENQDDHETPCHGKIWILEEEKLQVCLEIMHRLMWTSRNSLTRMSALEKVLALLFEQELPTFERYDEIRSKFFQLLMELGSTDHKNALILQGLTWVCRTPKHLMTVMVRALENDDDLLIDGLSTKLNMEKDKFGFNFVDVLINESFDTGLAFLNMLLQGNAAHEARLDLLHCFQNHLIVKTFECDDRDPVKLLVTFAEELLRKWDRMKRADNSMEHFERIVFDLVSCLCKLKLDKSGKIVDNTYGLLNVMEQILLKEGTGEMESSLIIPAIETLLTLMVKDALKTVSENPVANSALLWGGESHASGPPVPGISDELMNQIHKLVPGKVMLPLGSSLASILDRVEKSAFRVLLHHCLVKMEPDCTRLTNELKEFAILVMPGIYNLLRFVIQRGQSLRWWNNVFQDDDGMNHENSKNDAIQSLLHDMTATQALELLNARFPGPFTLEHALDELAEKLHQWNESDIDQNAHDMYERVADDVEERAQFLLGIAPTPLVRDHSTFPTSPKTGKPYADIWKKAAEGSSIRKRRKRSKSCPDLSVFASPRASSVSRLRTFSSTDGKPNVASPKLSVLLHQNQHMMKDAFQTPLGKPFQKSTYIKDSEELGQDNNNNKQFSTLGKDFVMDRANTVLGFLLDAKAECEHLRHEMRKHETKALNKFRALVLINKMIHLPRLRGPLTNALAQAIHHDQHYLYGISGCGLYLSAQITKAFRTICSTLLGKDLGRERTSLLVLRSMTIPYQYRSDDYKILLETGLLSKLGTIVSEDVIQLCSRKNDASSSTIILQVTSRKSEDWQRQSVKVVFNTLRKISGIVIRWGSASYASPVGQEVKILQVEACWAMWTVLNTLAAGNEPHFLLRDRLLEYICLSAIHTFFLAMDMSIEIGQDLIDRFVGSTAKLLEQGGLTSRVEILLVKTLERTMFHSEVNPVCTLLKQEQVPSRLMKRLEGCIKEFVHIEHVEMGASPLPNLDPIHPGLQAKISVLRDQTASCILDSHVFESKGKFFARGDVIRVSQQPTLEVSFQLTRLKRHSRTPGLSDFDSRLVLNGLGIGFAGGQSVRSSTPESHRVVAHEKEWSISMNVQVAGTSFDCGDANQFGFLKCIIFEEHILEVLFHRTFRIAGLEDDDEFITMMETLSHGRIICILGCNSIPFDINEDDREMARLHNCLQSVGCARIFASGEMLNDLPWIWGFIGRKGTKPIFEQISHDYLGFQFPGETSDDERYLLRLENLTNADLKAHVSQKETMTIHLWRTSVSYVPIDKGDAVRVRCQEGSDASHEPRFIVSIPRGSLGNPLWDDIHERDILLSKLAMHQFNEHPMYPAQESLFQVSVLLDDAVSKSTLWKLLGGIEWMQDDPSEKQSVRVWYGPKFQCDRIGELLMENGFTVKVSKGDHFSRANNKRWSHQGCRQSSTSLFTIATCLTDFLRRLLGHWAFKEVVTSCFVNEFKQFTYAILLTIVGRMPGPIRVHDHVQLTSSIPSVRSKMPNLCGTVRRIRFKGSLKQICLELPEYDRFGNPLGSSSNTSAALFWHDDEMLVPINRTGDETAIASGLSSVEANLKIELLELLENKLAEPTPDFQTCLLLKSLTILVQQHMVTLSDFTEAHMRAFDQMALSPPGKLPEQHKTSELAWYLSNIRDIQGTKMKETSFVAKQEPNAGEVFLPHQKEDFFLCLPSPTDTQFFYLEVRTDGLEILKQVDLGLTTCVHNWDEQSVYFSGEDGSVGTVHERSDYCLPSTISMIGLLWNLENGTVSFVLDDVLRHVGWHDIFGDFRPALAIKTRPNLENSVRVRWAIPASIPFGLKQKSLSPESLKRHTNAKTFYDDVANITDQASSPPASYLSSSGVGLQNDATEVISGEALEEYQLEGWNANSDRLGFPETKGRMINMSKLIPPNRREIPDMTRKPELTPRGTRRTGRALVASLADRVNRWGNLVRTTLSEQAQLSSEEIDQVIDHLSGRSDTSASVGWIDDLNIPLPPRPTLLEPISRTSTAEPTLRGVDPAVNYFIGQEVLVSITADETEELWHEYDWLNRFPFVKERLHQPLSSEKVAEELLKQQCVFMSWVSPMDDILLLKKERSRGVVVKIDLDNRCALVMFERSDVGSTSYFWIPFGLICISPQIVADGVANEDDLLARFRDCIDMANGYSCRAMLLELHCNNTKKPSPCLLSFATSLHILYADWIFPHFLQHGSLAHLLMKENGSQWERFQFSMVKYCCGHGIDEVLDILGDAASNNATLGNGVSIINNFPLRKDDRRFFVLRCETACPNCFTFAIQFGKDVLRTNMGLPDPFRSGELCFQEPFVEIFENPLCTTVLRKLDKYVDNSNHHLHQQQQQDEEELENHESDRRVACSQYARFQRRPIICRNSEVFLKFNHVLGQNDPFPTMVRISPIDGRLLTILLLVEAAVCFSPLGMEKRCFHESLGRLCTEIGRLASMNRLLPSLLRESMFRTVSHAYSRCGSEMPPVVRHVLGPLMKELLCWEGEQGSASLKEVLVTKEKYKRTPSTLIQAIFETIGFHLANYPEDDSTKSEIGDFVKISTSLAQSNQNYELDEQICAFLDDEALQNNGDDVHKLFHDFCSQVGRIKEEVFHTRCKELLKWNQLFQRFHGFVDMRMERVTDGWCLSACVARCRSLIMGSLSEKLVDQYMRQISHASGAVRPKVVIDRWTSPASGRLDHFWKAPSGQLITKPVCIFPQENTKPIFEQAFRQLSRIPGWHFRQQGQSPHVAFEVCFANENVAGEAGPWREFFSIVCKELLDVDLSGDVCILPLFIHTPNGQAGTGEMREKFIARATNCSPASLKRYEFLGRLLGCALLTGITLPLDFPPLFWKLLTSFPVDDNDLTVIDIASMKSPNGRFSDHCPMEPPPDPCLFVELRLHESRPHIDAIRSGFTQIVPSNVLSILAWWKLENMLCGNPVIDIELLQRHTKYSGVEEDAPHITYFWEVLREFTNEQRRQFIRFAWGQERLPRNDHDFQKRHVRMLIKRSFQSRNDPDNRLPRADTCFFNVELPNYSSKEITRKRLLTAITIDFGLNGDDMVL